MPIQILPSFWSDLGQGLSNFADERTKQQELEQQRLNSLIQLYGTGGVDASNLNSNPIMQKLGVTVQPSQGEQRRSIISRDAAPTLQVPTGISAGPAGVPVTTPVKTARPPTDTERMAAGLPTQGELATSQSQVNTSAAASAKARAILAMSRGEPIDENAAAAFGLSTPSDIEAEKIKRTDPLIEGAAQRHVSQVINAFGGRITAQNIKQISTLAFQNYLRTRSATKLGQLTPEESSYAQSFFDQATRNAYEEQRKLDIAQQAANARYGNINLGQNREYLTAIQNQQNATQQEMQAIEKNVPGLSYYLENPTMAAGPAFAGPIARYKALQDRQKRLQDAMSMLASGVVPNDIANLLSASGEAVPRGNATGSVPTGAPPVANPPKGVPSAAPKDQATPGGPPPMTADQLKQAQYRLSLMPVDAANATIDRGVATGRISQADAAKLRRKK